MSILEKTAKLLFVVAIALIFIALTAKIYRTGENRRFLVPKSESSVARREKNSNSSFPSSRVPAEEKELVKLPGGDVGYASDVADDFEDEILKDEVHDSTVAVEDLPSATTDAETVPTQSPSDSNSLPTTFESNPFPNESVADEASIANLSAPTASGDDSSEAVTNDWTLASNQTDEKSLTAPSVPEPVRNDSNSDDVSVQEPDVTTSSEPSANELATNDLFEPDDQSTDIIPSVESEISTSSEPSADELATNDLFEPNDQSTDIIPPDESEVSTTSEPSADELATNDLPEPNDQSTSALPSDKSEVSTTSEPTTDELATNDLPEPNDLSTDIIPPDESEVSTTSESSADELATNDLSEPNDQSTDIIPPDESEVSTTSESSADELATNGLPESDDQSTSALPSDKSEVSTGSELSADELATNDLPEFDDLTANISLQDDGEISTNSEPSSDELAASELSEPDARTVNILQPDDSEISTNSEPSSDELAANELSKPDDSEISTNSEPSSDELAVNALPESDDSEISTNSEPSSDELEVNDLSELEDQTVNILQPDDSDVSTTSEPSADELAVNDLPPASDNPTDATDSIPSFGELTADNLSKADVTDVLKTSDSSSKDFGVNDAPKSDGWTSWHSDSAIETLPDGLGTISSKPSLDESSSTPQDDALVANQTSQQNDARTSESVKPDAPAFDLSSFELRENEPTNYYLERWNALDKAWQEYLAPLSDEERLTVIEHNQSQMDQICLVITKRLAFADDLSANKRDGFFRLYASLLANAKKTSELTSLLMEERANKSEADARLGYLEVLIFEARVQNVGDMKDSDGLLNLSKELVQAASTSNVKYFLRKTKYLANLIGQYDKNLGERTFSVICQEFANSQDKFRRNMPNVFAGEARFESLPGNELLLGGMSVDGRDVDLLNYRGKTTLVVFTNSSCAPYLDELPSLRDVYAKYHSVGFEIVEYNLDADVEGLRKFIQTQNLPWTVVSQRLTAQVDGRDFVNPCVYYGIANLPTAILLDKNGKVISTLARRGRLTEELAEIYPNIR